MMMTQTKLTAAAEKRVRVAKDVLARIQAGQIKADTGNWLRVPIGANLDAAPGEVTCECCALGAILFSAATSSKRGTLGMLLGESDDLGGDILDGRKTRLSGLFSRKQAMLIEQAYEGPFGYFGTEEDLPQTHLAMDFYEKHRDDNSERLCAIMQNIIDHGGRFEP
jgi:hypothetical protein